ncbi:hypothetical protein TWF481_002321 [Arthrobotrys musiformis]|uniref:Uncharacterized protein n=1 Tax=Arthrobotrys musiformis TaxID=47236 RepID=A0AAV9VV98_9PEZI
MSGAANTRSQKGKMKEEKKRKESKRQPQDVIDTILQEHRTSTIAQIRADMVCNEYARKGVGIATAHGDLPSVSIFEELFGVRVPAGKQAPKRYPWETSIPIAKLQQAMADDFTKIDEDLEMGLTNEDVKLRWSQLPMENQGRFSVEAWYGDQAFSMTLKEASSVISLSTKSRAEYLARK